MREEFDRVLNLVSILQERSQLSSVNSNDRVEISQIKPQKGLTGDRISEMVKNVEAVRLFLNENKLSC
jgi:hypothetical protein